jgi:hypothetical protein
VQNLSHNGDMEDMYIFTVGYAKQRGCSIEMI